MNNTEQKIGHYTGSCQSHIFLHSTQKVVCGTHSPFELGLNEDIDIERAIKYGIELIVSCKRCIKWFNKNFTKTQK